MKLSFSSLQLVVAAACLFATPGFAASPASPTPQSAASITKAQAMTRYASDKKICKEEPTATARMQCRRDAKSDYEAALTASIAAVQAPAVSHSGPVIAPFSVPAPATTAASAQRSDYTMPPCPECGQVLAVSVTQRAGEPSAAGVLAGGAIGAVLGHQVGGGVGKDLATLAGALGGAYAGRVIEGKIKTHTVWTVTVLYFSEDKTSFEFNTDPGLQVGQRVKNSGNSIVRY